ncbi:hypothetical protein AB0J68_01495 [Micromonospora sp. NPDC049580]|uniref:hypothetical protein n=1 Tax=Micromonospora sp. NPDC049580 TaxID=3154832 RepID=UPI003419D90E
MARDVEADVVVRDKTNPGIKSVERNVKKVADQSNKVTAQLNRGVAQWGKGFQKLGSAASRWANSGDSTGKRFARGVGAGLGKIAELGGAVGGGLSKAVTAAGPQVALAVSAVLVGAAVSAAPAVGAALVGGAGGAGIVGGLVIASKDARVAKAFDDLGDEVGSSLQEAAGRFVPASLEAVKEARSAFRGMTPDLKRIFDVSATWLPGLTRSLGSGAQLALSGITKAVTKAGPIFTQFGKGLEGILGATGKVFGDLADNGSSMALALRGTLELVKFTILGVGGALNLLIETFEFFVNRIPGGKKLLDSMVSSQDGAKTSAFNLAGGFQLLADDANAAADGLTNAKQKADDLVNSNIGLAQAQIASRDATRQAADAIKENSKAKLSNAQRADANRTALLSMADAFNTETSAGEASKISAGKASEAYATNRQKLIAAAEAAGYTRSQAEKLAGQWLKVPKNVTTTVNANTGAASAKLETFQKKITNLKGKTVNVTVQVTQRGDHRIPGVGTQLKDAAGDSWYQSDGGMTSRTGGPVRVESTVNQTLNVSLDGRPFYAYTARAIRGSEKRTAWRQKVGVR